MLSSFFGKSSRLWDNVEKICGAKGAANDTTQRIRVACWISKATSTHAYAHVHVPWHPHTHTRRQTCYSDCFSTATMIRERASVLRYTYIACLVSSIGHSARCYQLQDRAKRSASRRRTVKRRYSSTHWQAASLFSNQLYFLAALSPKNSPIAPDTHFIDRSEFFTARVDVMARKNILPLPGIKPPFPLPPFPKSISNSVISPPQQYEKKLNLCNNTWYCFVYYLN
jgi:hypothetical protein